MTALYRHSVDKEKKSIVIQEVDLYGGVMTEYLIDLKDDEAWVRVRKARIERVEYVEDAIKLETDKGVWVLPKNELHSILQPPFNEIKVALDNIIYRADQTLQ